MEFGGFSIFPVSDGFYRLDGGAMFGVVPRVMWEGANPPDGRNRVLLGLNPLLVRTGRENILIDTGIGDKGTERFNSFYAVDRSHSLSGSLAALGLGPDDIDMVINTHLHFDHAGGNTVWENGSFRPAFPRARYIVQRGEWEAALNPNERTRASYRKEDFAPVMEAGQLDLVEGDGEIAAGVSLLRAPGHNRDTQVVSIRSGGKTAVYLGDLIPTTAHLNLPFIAAYDLFPLDTLRAKKEMLAQAAQKKWLLLFGHDPDARMGYVEMKGGRPEFEKVM